MSLFPKTVYDKYLYAVAGSKLEMVADPVDWTQTLLGAQFRIGRYTPRLNAAVGWLPLVSSRIRKSVPPTGFEPSTEWLNEAAANAALSFFDQAADLLPNEPHIYGMHSGDLVAEFATDRADLTAVISAEEIILFSAPKAGSSPPKEKIIKRTQNVRDQVREFTREL